MSDPSSVRLGIVGLGNIARIHCEALDASGLEETLVAGVDVDPDARAAFAETYDVTVYEDHEEILDEVDAVLVTTPNRFHEEYVVDALEAGLDVLVEKPLAHTLESATRIAETAHDAEGFCMVGFHNRFAKPVEVLDEYREQGELGAVTHVEADYIRRRGIPARGSWFTRKSVSGGGSLIDIGVHALDLALYLAGYPEVVEVSGVTRANFGTDDGYSYVQMWGEDQGASDFDVDDSVSALIRCADGTTISLEVAWASNRPSSQQYYVRGDEAGAGLDLASGELTLYETSDRGGNHHRTTDVETQASEAHVDETVRFVEAVAAGEAPERNTVDEALAVQKVIDGIYRSSEAGEAVRIE
ncbi:Gfo/Idh/MocA family protein [Haloarcula pelagica]|uniref:Gfo/Idh/MocA family protein n=1 Tax=Haloarcula pelagica TaxID=3033389 RepID=UPI0024C41B29|nr:Gfo/Idh/MocA family oxidoreductase [Halomicroarcula sp. YJ-61-S]